MPAHWVPGVEYSENDPYVKMRNRAPERLEDYTVGLDLGQLSDPSALALCRRVTYPLQDRLPEYEVPALKRWEIGTPYPRIVQDVVKVVTTGEAAGARLAVDATGVGRPVVDMLRQTGLTLTACSITSGRGVSVSGSEVHVPKIHLVGLIQSLLGTGRLKVARSDPLSEVLLQECRTFKVKVTAAGNEVFGADWRENAHDDILLALCVGLFVADRYPAGGGQPVFGKMPQPMGLAGPQQADEAWWTA
jgi:hypothetical protein